MSVIDILLQKQKITKEEVGEIRRRISNGASMDEALLANGVDPSDIVTARGEFLNIPVKSISANSIPFEVLEYIPEESAVHYKIAPISVTDGVLEVGVVDPDNMDARDALNFIAAKKNIPYKICLITIDDFNKVLEAYKGITGEVNQALNELEAELTLDTRDTLSTEELNVIGQKSKDGKDTVIIEEAPIIKIVATIIRYAVDGGASDVHIEPMRDKLRVRFRVDGVLNTSLILPPAVHPAVVARIKVMSKMRLDEKRMPQDGRTRVDIIDDNGKKRQIDFRVSTFPSHNGEKVVLRILDQAKGGKDLLSLGMSDDHARMFREAINRPYGLILITGPTGSGKSTTLYSLLSEVDRESYNVLSLEDPVEYSIEGVNQSQVNEAIGYSFSNGLRTTLRQDPDIIMVGEIRDSETAKLAIQAALTGHLVLSTLHTNSSTGAIPRLIDMGVDPYLIAPTLVLAVAQRLVGVRAPNAGELVPVDGAIKSLIDKSFADLPEEHKKKIPFADQVYKNKLTADAPRGTRGRKAVFEMFMMDKDIEQAILKNPVESEIYKIVRSKGMLTMKEDAIIKAFNKEIPFEEVTKLGGDVLDM